MKMAKNNNWVKIHRSVLDWEWYNEHKTFKLLMFLIIKCNYEDKRWKGKEVKRGQLYTSYPHLSRDTGLSYQEVRTNLDRLIDSNVIKKNSTGNNTLITLINYEDYQSTNETNNTKKTGKKHSNNIQITTTKESKEVKEINNSFSEIEINSFFELFKNEFNKVAKRENKTYKYTPAIKKQFITQLNNGYSIDNMIKAIKNLYSKSDSNAYWRDNNFNGATPGHLLKDDNINKFMNTTIKDKSISHPALKRIS